MENQNIDNNIDEVVSIKEQDKYYLFCDEAYTNKGNKYMLIGGFYIRKDLYRNMCEEIRQVLKGYNHEIKYIKIKDKRSNDIALNILRIFHDYCDKNKKFCKYKIFVCDKSDIEEHKKNNNIFKKIIDKKNLSIYFDNFFKYYYFHLYYQYRFVSNENKNYMYYFLDYNTTFKKNKQKINYLHCIKENLCKNNHKYLRLFDSKKVLGIQIADLLIGVVGALLNNNSITNKYKKNFIKKVQNILGFNKQNIDNNKSNFWIVNNNKEEGFNPVFTNHAQSTEIQKSPHLIISQQNNKCQGKNEENQQDQPRKSIDYTALNNEILSHRLSDVIGRYCHLQNEGAGRKKCRCPFHHEKTPSFHLDDNKGLWHCFGCGEGGNIFTFIQKIKGCDFPRAVDELCDIFGIDKKKYIVYQDEEEVEKTKNFYQTMEIVAEFYKENLRQNQEALDYLHIIRGLDDNILEEFSFGLADNDINKILQYCIGKGCCEQDLIKCGIIKEPENEDGFERRKYLFFRDRIIIPIHNAQGKIVAFGGRIYKAGDDGAKYLNSSENDYFKKGNILFNFNRARRNLKKDNYLIIVEGYMDAIALHSHGFNTAIAPLGTSITEEHLKTILNYCDKPLFLFDSDNAGKKASMRACEMFFPILNTGKIPRFCSLNGAKDVDEFLKKYTIKDLQEQFDNSLDINTFLFENKAKSFNLEDPNQVSILQKEIYIINSRIQDINLKDNYKVFFTEKINEIKTNNLKNKALRNKRYDNNFSFQNKKPSLNTDSLDFLEKQMISIILKYNNDINTDEFFESLLPNLSRENQQIFEELNTKQDDVLINDFCDRYIKNVIQEDMLDNVDNIFNSLILKWRLLKIRTSNSNEPLKFEEMKKIIENKKKFFKQNFEDY